MELTHGLEDRPGLGRLLLYGLQWTLLTLPILTVSTNLAADFLGYDQAMRTALGQRFLILIGLTMIFQGTLGHRLPLVDGPAGALLLCLITLAPSGEAVVRGSLMAGGAILALAAHLGLLKRIEPLFSRDMVGVVVLLIAFTILPFLLPLVLDRGPAAPLGRPWAAVTAVGLTLLIPALGHWLKGFPRSLSVLMALVLGTFLFGVMGRLELGRIAAAPWLGWPLPFPTGPPRLSVAGLTAACLAYFVLLANLKGSLAGVQEVVGGGRSQARTRRGAAVSGWAGVLAGAAGGYGPVAYALSPGVILSTGVGSRWTTVSAGGLILGLGFCSKMAAALAVVPGPVVAAAMIASMAAQIGTGLSILTKGGRELAGRDYFVIGLPLLLGTLSSLLPREFISLLPPLIGPLAGNGLVVGLISLVLLEWVVLRKGNLP